jgi:DNA uptake protein ComE-like DNA-binding protein
MRIRVHRVTHAAATVSFGKGVMRNTILCLLVLCSLGHVINAQDRLTVAVTTRQVLPTAVTLIVSPAPAPPPEPTVPPTGVASGFVNLNTASAADLERIIHIGPKRAADIIRLRPFRSIDDLERVDGLARRGCETSSNKGSPVSNDWRRPAKVFSRDAATRVVSRWRTVTLGPGVAPREPRACSRSSRPSGNHHD